MNQNSLDSSPKQLVLIRDGEKEWLEPPAEWKGKAQDGQPGVTFKSLLRSPPGGLNMQRSRYEPGHFEPPHSHPEDEIIYLLAGSIVFGTETLVPGDALFIPGNTTYSLRGGTEGTEFLRVGLPIPTEA